MRRTWTGSRGIPDNFASCRGRPWRSFQKIVSPFYHWVESQTFRHLPLMLAEYGTIGNPSGPHSKQNWYAGVAPALSAFPAIKAVVYFDYPSPPASCDWTSNSTEAASAGFSSLAHSRVFLPSSAAAAELGSVSVPANP